MAVISIFVFVAALAVFAVSISIAAAALGFAIGTLKASASEKTSKQNIFILIIGAAFFFLITIVFLGNVDPRSNPTFTDWALLSYLVLIISILALSAVSLILRFFNRFEVKKKIRQPISATVIFISYAVLFLGIRSTGDFLLFKLDDPAPPIELTLGGTATHCVYSSSGVTLYESPHQRDRLLNLSKGEKVQLNISDTEVGRLGDTRYVLIQNADRKIVYGRGVFLKANAKGECR